MKTETTNETKAAMEMKPPGLFTRIFERLDRVMKDTAEKKAAGDSCCAPGGKRGQDGKCC